VLRDLLRRDRVDHPAVGSVDSVGLVRTAAADRAHRELLKEAAGSAAALPAAAVATLEGDIPAEAVARVSEFDFFP
jgi:hypothetical protein